LLLGAESGAYISYDTSTTWYAINDGFDTIRNLRTYKKSNNYIYAVTNNGLWRRAWGDVVGIKEPEPLTEIAICPNPASDKLTISGIEGMHDVYYEIYNLQSARIKQAALHKPEMDISDLPDGIYVLKLHTPDGVVTRKIIKMKQ
jgi:hypothetical protein